MRISTPKATEARVPTDGERRRTRPARFALAAALVGTALLAAACGGSPSTGVASLGPTTTTPAAAPFPGAGGGDGTTAKYRASLSYAKCMRARGVPDFPDPSSDGQLNVDFAHGGKDGTAATSGVDRNSPQYLSADRACRHLLPGGTPTPAQRQQALAEALKVAQCMRSHGVPTYPDPDSSDPGVVHLGPGVDISSPQFQHAQKVCASIVPGSGSK